MKMLFRNCRLIPELSDGVVTEHGAVLTEGGKIIRVSASEIPFDGRTIDCGGKTLLPGLIDLHVHLCTHGCGMGIEYKDDFSLLADGCRNALSFLKNGYTTIRDMGSTNGVAVTVRNMIQSGTVTGPRIIAAGRMLLPVGLLEKSIANTAYHEISGRLEIERAVREEIGVSRADVIKIYASGSAFSPDGEPQLAIMTSEEVQAAVHMAGFRGRKVAAHCHSNTAIHICLEAGVYTIEHGSYLDDSAIKKLKAGKSYLVPTMAPYYHMHDPKNDQMTEAYFASLMDTMGKNVGEHMYKAYDAGLMLGFGSDTIDGQFEGRIGMEFRLRKELCGMRETDILLQATKYSAKIAGLENVTGEIKEGLDADLILMDGNPDIDISVMYHLPELIVARGKIIGE